MHPCRIPNALPSAKTRADCHPRPAFSFDFFHWRSGELWYIEWPALGSTKMLAGPANRRRLINRAKAPSLTRSSAPGHSPSSARHCRTCFFLQLKTPADSHAISGTLLPAHPLPTCGPYEYYDGTRKPGAPLPCSSTALSILRDAALGSVALDTNRHLIAFYV